MRCLLRHSAVLLLLIIAPLYLACHGTTEAPARLAPRGADVRLASQTVVVRSVVPQNATLDTLLSGYGLPADTVAHVVDAVRTVFDPRQLRSRQPFGLERSTAGGLRVFEYEIDSDSFLRVTSRTADETDLGAEILRIPKTVEQAAVAGVIDEQSSSLFAAMSAAGESADLAVALAQIFSGEIDFNTEIQRNDRFALAFERFHREDGPATHGDVLAAEIRNEGRVHRAIRFTVPGGVPAYYDEQGRSVRRLFLKSPLEFARVTSKFSMSRMHPVLHMARAHRGVDYGAPTGAPVVSVASGTVVSASYDSANGRMVRVRHASGYVSYYLHLSGFAKEIRAGAHVSQGQRIGFVGATGLATGPHLHYGLTKNGTFVNPVLEHRNMPPGEPIPTAAMPAFNEVRDRAVTALAAATNATN
jgi:murein DD-endopeptidase MepM/ murein hydrolase activator NlpD